MNNLGLYISFKISIFFAILLLFLPSCLSMMPATNSSARTYYESYFLENGPVQLFIKPLPFNAETDRLFIDFTIRNNQDSCTANFSVLSPLQIVNPEVVFILNSQFSVQLSEINKLYSDRIKLNYKTRFTSKLAVSDLSNLMKNGDWNLKFVSGTQVEVFEGKSKNAKQILKLKPILNELINPVNSN